MNTSFILNISISYQCTLFANIDKILMYERIFVILISRCFRFQVLSIISPSKIFTQTHVQSSIYLSIYLSILICSYLSIDFETQITLMNFHIHIFFYKRIQILWMPWFQLEAWCTWKTKKKAKNCPRMKMMNTLWKVWENVFRNFSLKLVN